MITILSLKALCAVSINQTDWECRNQFSIYISKKTYPLGFKRHEKMERLPFFVSLRKHKRILFEYLKLIKVTFWNICILGHSAVVMEERMLLSTLIPDLLRVHFVAFVGSFSLFDSIVRCLKSTKLGGNWN